MSLLLLLQSSGGAPPPPTPTVTYPVVTINGTEVQFIVGTLDISENTNGRNVMSCVVKSRGTRWLVDDEIIVTYRGVREFGGTINSLSELGLGPQHLRLQIDANDFNALADRRYLSTTLAAGTLKSIFTTVIGHFPDVTVDPTQVTGPLLDALTYDYTSVTEVLNDLASLTGYVWEIDYNKVARMFNPSSSTAPFNITTAQTRILEDLEVIQNPRTDYANRIIYRYGSGQANVTETFTASGVAYSFPLGYKFFSDFQVVTNNGNPESLTIQGIGFDNAVQWLYYASDNTIRRLTAGTPDPPAAGHAIGITYTAQFPGTIIREDVPSQAPPIGIIERKVENPDVFDTATAEALADAELARRLERLTTVRYVTREGGLRSGMIQNINVVARNVNADYTLTDIRINDDSDGVLRRSVTAVQGTTIRDTWRDVYKRWNSGGVTSTGGGVGSGGGGIAFIRNAYFLGGSSIEYVQSSTPTWTPASAVQVTLDTTARGGTTAMVTARLRATSGSVTARLQNVTDNITVGTSSVVSSPAWTNVSFAVSLTPGNKVYELQVSPSLANIDVAATGYLE